MNEKYELIDESIDIDFLGQKLFRIRAKAAFSGVAKGEKGGYVAAEKNLSPYGNAWIFGNARVSGNAEVSGNAKVGGDARLARPSDILVIGPAGSRDDYLTVTVSNGKARIGCFAGTLDELEAAAKERQRQDYLDLLPGIRAMINRRCNA